MQLTYDYAPPMPFKFERPCDICGFTMVMEGNHHLNAYHNFACKKCKTMYVFRSEWCYPPGYEDGAWLYNRIEMLEVVKPVEKKSWWEKISKWLNT